MSDGKTPAGPVPAPRASLLSQATQTAYSQVVKLMGTPMASMTEPSRGLWV